MWDVDKLPFWHFYVQYRLPSSRRRLKIGPFGRVVDRINCHTYGHKSFSDLRTFLSCGGHWNDDVLQYLASILARHLHCKASSATPSKQWVSGKSNQKCAINWLFSSFTIWPCFTLCMYPHNSHPHLLYRRHQSRRKLIHLESYGYYSSSHRIPCMSMVYFRMTSSSRSELNMTFIYVPYLHFVLKKTWINLFKEFFDHFRLAPSRRFYSRRCCGC